MTYAGTRLAGGDNQQALQNAQFAGMITYLAGSYRSGGGFGVAKDLLQQQAIGGLFGLVDGAAYTSTRSSGAFV